MQKERDISQTSIDVPKGRNNRRGACKSGTRAMMSQQATFLQPHPFAQAKPPPQHSCLLDGCFSKLQTHIQFASRNFIATFPFLIRRCKLCIYRSSGLSSVGAAINRLGREGAMPGISALLIYFHTSPYIFEMDSSFLTRRGDA